MILVSVGTVSYPFPRLVQTAARLLADKQLEPVVIQCGVGKYRSNSSHISFIPYMSFDRMIKAYREASLVISAAGEASPNS